MGIRNEFADTLAQLVCANTTQIGAGYNIANLGGTESKCFLGFCTAAPEYTTVGSNTYFETHEVDPYAGRTDVASRAYPSYARAFIGEVIQSGNTVTLNAQNKLVPSSAKSRSSIGATTQDIPYGTVTNWATPIFGSVCDEDGGWPAISHFILCNSELGYPSEFYISGDVNKHYNSSEAKWWGALTSGGGAIAKNQVPVFKAGNFTISVSATTQS